MPVTSERKTHVFVLTAKTVRLFSEEWKHSEQMRHPQFESDDVSGNWEYSGNN